MECQQVFTTRQSDKRDWRAQRQQGENVVDSAVDGGGWRELIQLFLSFSHSPARCRLVVNKTVWPRTSVFLAPLFDRPTDRQDKWEGESSHWRYSFHRLKILRGFLLLKSHGDDERQRRQMLFLLRLRLLVRRRRPTRNRRRCCAHRGLAGDEKTRTRKIITKLMTLPPLLFQPLSIAFSFPFCSFPKRIFPFGCITVWDYSKSALFLGKTLSTLGQCF